MTKRILDEATKQALLGVAPLSSNSTISFTPEVYAKVNVAEEFKPLFKIRGLTIEEKSTLDNLVSEAASSSVDKNAWNEKAFELTRKVLVDWGGVFDVGSGEEIAFIAEAGSCSPSIFNMLPVIIKSQLFGCVMKMHGLVDTAKMGLP